MFRSLPPLAKKYVLQLLYIDAAVSDKLLEEWVLADGVSKHIVAIDRLIQLRVLTETLDRLHAYSGLHFLFHVIACRITYPSTGSLGYENCFCKK